MSAGMNLNVCESVCVNECGCVILLAGRCLNECKCVGVIESGFVNLCAGRLRMYLNVYM